MSTPHTFFAPAERETDSVISRQHEALMQSEHFRIVMDRILDLVVILNDKRQIVFANSQVLSTFGVSHEALCGLRPGEAVGCVFAGREEGGCGTSQFCKECGAVNAILESLNGHRDIRECHILKHDTSALTLLVSAAPFYFGDASYTLFTMKDISNEKRRESLERIFYHDLMNVASGLMACAEVMRDELADAGDSTLVDIMLSASNQLVGEIHFQKIFTMAESGELVTKKDSLQSLSLLKELCDFYQNHGAGKRRTLRIAPQSAEVGFTSDRVIVSRVVGNMLKNALEATEPGGEVVAAVEDAGAYVEFTVHNPAVMPENVQLQIFQRSFSTKGIGRGLGTYSMKLLTEKYLKGVVHFVSLEGVGTTFTALIPKTC